MIIMMQYIIYTILLLEAAYIILCNCAAREYYNDLINIKLSHYFFKTQQLNTRLIPYLIAYNRANQQQIASWVVKIDQMSDED